MNAFPMYAVWNCDGKCWVGKHFGYTSTTNFEKAVSIAHNLFRATGNEYQVIESHDLGLDKVVYSTGFNYK